MKTEIEARDQIKELRARIDEIDGELVRLLNRRAELVQGIGAAKHSAGLDVFDNSREENVFRNVQSHNRGPLPEQALRAVYEHGIIPVMRSIQKSTRE